MVGPRAAASRVFRTADDEVFALDDRCPHKGGPLSNGIVHGHSVTCPLHNWVFSLATGEAQGADEGRVRTHARPRRGRPHPARTRRAGLTAMAGPHHLPLLRRRLRRPRDAPTAAAGDGRRRPRASGELRPALLEGQRARRDRRPRRPAARPRIDGRDASWDEALDLVAGAYPRGDREHGPDSVAIYVSGQLLTEDYYVANKLMKGFIGAANIDTNSRLCMASSVAGHRRAFGADTVPGTYEDLEEADLVVLVGSNLAWCHPVLHQRLAAAKAARPEMRVVTVDPRRTATTELADLHLALAPDTDVALFNAPPRRDRAAAARSTAPTSPPTSPASTPPLAAAQARPTPRGHRPRPPTTSPPSSTSGSAPSGSSPCSARA